MTTPTPTADAKPAGRGVLRAGIILLVLSVLMGIGGIVLIVITAAGGVVSGSEFRAPGTQKVTLEPGTYEVFENTGRRSRSGSSTMDWYPPTIGPSDVKVTDPSGANVPVRSSQGTQTQTRNSIVYSAAAEFEAKTAGTYTVTVSDVPSVEVFVGRSIFATLGGIFGGVGLIIVSGIVFFIGLILLIIGLVQRSKSKRPPLPPPYGSVPPSGYAPPPGPGGYAPPPGPGGYAPPPGPGGYAPPPGPGGYAPPPAPGPAAPPPGPAAPPPAPTTWPPQTPPQTPPAG